MAWGLMWRTSGWRGIGSISAQNFGWEFGFATVEYSTFWRIGTARQQVSMDQSIIIPVFSGNRGEHVALTAGGKTIPANI